MVGSDEDYKNLIDWASQGGVSNEFIKEYAQAVGYTVVDASTVIATHLNSVIKDNADELMTYDVAQQLIDKIAETSP